MSFSSKLNSLWNINSNIIHSPVMLQNDILKLLLFILLYTYFQGLLIMFIVHLQ